MVAIILHGHVIQLRNWKRSETDVNYVTGRGLIGDGWTDMNINIHDNYFRWEEDLVPGALTARASLHMQLIAACSS